MVVTVVTREVEAIIKAVVAEAIIKEVVVEVMVSHTHFNRLLDY